MRTIIVLCLLALSVCPKALAKVSRRLEPAGPRVGTLVGSWKYVCRDGYPIGGPMTLILAADGGAKEIIRMSDPNGIAVITEEGKWKPGGESAGHAGWKEVTSFWDDGKTVVKWRCLLVPDMDVLEVVEETGRHPGAVVLYVREK
ncbi:MAG: hypothetical protein QOI66_4572 [Myxococcales bacterium]|nr:hypothetical protein [Myxococcales bacterium]